MTTVYKREIDVILLRGRTGTKIQRGIRPQNVPGAAGCGDGHCRAAGTSRISEYWAASMKGWLPGELGPQIVLPQVRPLFYPRLKYFSSQTYVRHDEEI